MNAQKTQLTYKKCPSEPRKIPKIDTTLVLFYVDTRIFLKAIRGNGYRFVHKGGMFPTENHQACCEKLQFVRSLYPNLPQMGQYLYNCMLMPFHDSMSSFMNSDEFSIYQNFKTIYLNVSDQAMVAKVFAIHSHFLHGT